MIRIRIPRDPSVATKFFAQLTAKDIARFGVPVGGAYAAATRFGLNTVIAVLAGTVLGVLLVRFRPYGKTVDQLLLDSVIWLWNMAHNSYDRVYNMAYGQGSTHLIGTKRACTGTAAVYLKPDPVNLSLQTEDEQAALHNQLQELIETVSYPIKFHIVQEDAGIPEEQIVQYTVEDEPTDGDGLDHVAEAYRNYIDTNVGDSTTINVPLITIPVELPDRSLLQRLIPQKRVAYEDDLDEQITTLEHRTEEVLDTLDSALFDVGPVVGPDLDATFGLNLFKIQPLVGFTDSDKGYTRTVVIEGYPSQVEFGWPNKLLDCDGRIEVTQVVEPADTSSVMSTLNTAVEKLSAEIGSWLQAGYLGTTDLEARLDDAEWMLSRFTERSDNPVKYKAYVTARGESMEDCLEVYDEVTSRLDMMQFDYRLPLLETHRVRDAIVPTESTKTADTDIMPSSSAAAGFPFGVRPIPDIDGTLVGTDTRDSTPVFLNRFQWKAPHVVKLGATGSGKSYATKLELLRSAVTYDDTAYIVIDPKKEYDDVVEQLGGKVYELSETHTVDDVATGLAMTDSRFVALQPEERVSDTVNDILVTTVRGVYRATSNDDAKSIVVIDESHRLLNHSTEGKLLLSTFVREARDTQTGVTLISQNASDFAATKEGRALLDNVETTVFMQHERVPDPLIDYFNLSQQEVQDLLSLKTGTDCEYSEAIVKVSNRRNTKITVEAGQQEHAIIDSGRAGA